MVCTLMKMLTFMASPNMCYKKIILDCNVDLDRTLYGSVNHCVSFIQCMYFDPLASSKDITSWLSEMVTPSFKMTEISITIIYVWSTCGRVSLHCHSLSMQLSYFLHRFSLSISVHPPSRKLHYFHLVNRMTSTVVGWWHSSSLDAYNKYHNAHCGIQKGGGICIYRDSIRSYTKMHLLLWNLWDTFLWCVRLLLDMRWHVMYRRMDYYLTVTIITYFTTYSKQFLLFISCKIVIYFSNRWYLFVQSCFVYLHTLYILDSSLGL